MKTGLVFHELYLWHHTGNHADYVPYGFPVEPLHHSESPDSKRRIKNLMEVSGLYDKLIKIKPRKATKEEILLFHTENHYDHIKSLNESISVNAGISAPTGIGSFDIALLSTGGVIEALDHIIEGKVDNAYALVRPPGHHAMPNKAMGFCLFGNAAIAGKHALKNKGLNKIAFVDWDVHHGNGTQDIFYEDDSVFFFSTHQSPWYPGTGERVETGKGKGLGYTMNHPFAAGSGKEEILQYAFESELPRQMKKFKPELILISAGFDSRIDDPLGQFRLTDQDFYDLTKVILDLADEYANGNVISILEGGYNLNGLAKASAAHVQALLK